MRTQVSKGDARGVRLEATIRKAFADAWAREIPPTEAVVAVTQMVHKDYPEMSEDEVAAFIQNVRKNSG